MDDNFYIMSCSRCGKSFDKHPQEIVDLPDQVFHDECADVERAILISVALDLEDNIEEG